MRKTLTAGDVLSITSTGEKVIYLNEGRVWHNGVVREQIDRNLDYDFVGHDPAVSALLAVVDEIRAVYMLTTSFFSSVMALMETVKLDDFGALDYASRAAVCELLRGDDHYQEIRVLLKLDGLSQMEEACRTKKWRS